MKLRGFVLLFVFADVSVTILSLQTLNPCCSGFVVCLSLLSLPLVLCAGAWFGANLVAGESAMAGSKRKRDDGTGSEAPKRKKKKRPAHQELDPEGKLVAKRDEYPGVGGTSAVVFDEGDAGFEKEKGKRSGKKRGEAKKGLDNLESGPMSEVEPHKKKKEKKEKKKVQEEEDTALPPRLDDLQSVDLVSNGELQGKRKKKKEVISVPSTSVTSQIFEDQGLLSGTEPQRKKKKMKEGIAVPVALDSSQIAEEGQKKKKKTNKGVTLTPHTLDSPQVVEDGQEKKKTNKGVTPTPHTLDSPQVVEDGQKEKKTNKGVTPTPHTLDSPQVVEDGQKKKKKKANKGVTPTPPTLDSPQVVKDGQKKKKKTNKGVTPTPHTLELPQIVEDVQGSGAESHGKKEKKRKFSTVLSTPDLSQAAEDCGLATGSAKKTILKSQMLQAGNGAESDRTKKKKVTFQLPDRVEDEPSEKELLGEETQFTDLETSTWATDRLRPGLVYGLYTAKEDGILKQAVFDYIREQGWEREEGLQKILNSRRTEARGCWQVIRKCLPQRELKRIHARAHRILRPDSLHGKWSNEEMQSLTELHSVHGNDWKRLSTIIGRDPESCKDKWRYIKWSHSKDYKTGAWSEEEQQKLIKLVLKCLHVKAEMAKKGSLTIDHRLTRDDISWEFIAEQMGGRGRLDCVVQWYRKMASPMVTTGEWSNGDDQRLLQRLMDEFPLSEELVEWDSLLNNRSGETCKKRWEQMQRTLGRGPEVRHQHFLEKLESVMKRFAPHLLDTEYDQKFAEDMQRADAAEPEDLDV